MLEKRYPGAHDYATDKALYHYTQELKSQFLRNAPPINKVMYDSKIHVLKNALGLHTAVSRVQGGKLKARRRSASPPCFVTPGAILTDDCGSRAGAPEEKDHNKAFYQLCCHMEPQYHQLEFDTRLWLTHQALSAQ